jgi:prepilin-type N-terminal cleavage/methylation domain-containing protein
MGLPRRTAGFTLIELMVVASIMSIILLAFRASFTKAIANKRAIAAAAELVRLGRRGRAEAMGLQRAHLLYVDPSGANGLGIASLLRGNSTHCDLDDWEAFQKLCTANNGIPAQGSACVEYLDLSQSRWRHEPHDIRIRAISSGQEANASSYMVAGLIEGGVRSLCYEPWGGVQWSVTALGPAMAFDWHGTNQAASGAFSWTVGLAGIAPVLSFPLGGAPRRLR